jgi:hypothetical protein
MNKDIYLGNGKVNFPVGTSDLTEVNINNETYYKISNVDRMRPFFMSIVSNSNHWMAVYLPEEPTATMPFFPIILMIK